MKSYGREADIERREKTAEVLVALELPEEQTGARRRIVEVLRGCPGEDERLARAVEIMIQLIPVGLRGALGPRGHLLASVSREYRAEHDLLYLAIKRVLEDVKEPLPSPETTRDIEMPIAFIEDTESLVEGLLKPIDYEDDDLQDDPLTDYYEGKEAALSQLRVAANDVASFENDVDHSPGLSWRVDLTLFVAPIADMEGGFALFILDWDDNWGRWEWRCESALTGASSLKVATELLLKDYRDSYIAGAEDEFLSFLQNLC